MVDIVTTEARAALGLGTGSDRPQSTQTGAPFLPGPHPVSALAAAVMSVIAEAIGSLPGRALDPIVVDRGRADAWFGGHLEPIGWSLPSPWDPLSGAYPTRDGWIRTHTNAPHHRAALLRTLRIDERDPVTPDVIGAAILRRNAVELEEAVVASGGVAAALHSAADWAASTPGRAVHAEPLIGRAAGSSWDGVTAWTPTDDRPLAGLRVLDLTRVLAGPASTQVLAGLGADVLRVDPPDWDEPAVLPLVMADKRTTRLDARTPSGLRRLTELLSGADVLVHGYRAGALDRLGLAADDRARIRPGLVDVSERAYGWTGPWAERRGFDSVVQFSTGLAAVDAATGRPASLPVQALDWATGYLMAAAAVRGVAVRETTREGSSWALSLARTARALEALHTAAPADLADPTVGASPLASTIPVSTASGPASMVASPFSVGKTRLRFTTIPTALGIDAADWR